MLSRKSGCTTISLTNYHIINKHDKICKVIAWESGLKRHYMYQANELRK